MRNPTEEFIKKEKILLKELEEEFKIFNKPYKNTNLKEQFKAKILDQKTYIKTLEERRVHMLNGTKEKKEVIEDNEEDLELDS
jgi:hypothetical protein